VIERIALSGVMLLAAGCASVTGGNSDFSCPGMPNHPLCLSASQVYEATNASETVQSRSPAPAPLTKTAAVRMITGGGAAHAPMPDPREPLPIRTPARVMRIWIAPWEDVTGDLNALGYVYTEITPRRWAIGVRAPEQAAVITPLQVEPRRAKKTRKEASNGGQ